MQGTQILSLVWEDPTCCGATKLACHNYWTHALESELHSERTHCNEKPTNDNKDPTQPKKLKKNCLKVNIFFKKIHKIKEPSRLHSFWKLLKRTCLLTFICIPGPSAHLSRILLWSSYLLQLTLTFLLPFIKILVMILNPLKKNSKIAASR